MVDIDSFSIIDCETLMAKAYMPIQFIVENLFAPGLHILAGAPKAGKSWMALWFCLQIAKGEPVWGMPVEQGTVFYLALEDNENRLQNRLITLGDDAPANLFFSTQAPQLGKGLEQELERFLMEHKDAVLIVVDTLQMVRPSTFEYGYAGDYKDLAALRAIAQRYHIVMLLIHHLRKESSDDVFHQIAGTVGIQGAVDGCFTLTEEKRGGGAALLSCIGRDIAYREISLKKNENQIWEMVRDSDDIEREKDFLPERVGAFMEGRNSFKASPTEFAKLLSGGSGFEISPMTLLKRLDKNRRELKECGFSFQSRKSNGNRTIMIFRLPEVEGQQGQLDVLPGGV